jgi:hypothetical protein
MAPLPPRFGNLKREISSSFTALIDKVRGRDIVPVEVSAPIRVIGSHSRIGRMSSLPPRFADLKREIASSYPDFEERVTKAWAEIIDQLNETTKVIATEGSEVRRQLLA